MKTILAAVDFSDATSGVIKTASRLAHDLRARLVILNVIPCPVVVGQRESFQKNSEEILEKEGKDADVRLAKLKAGLIGEISHVETLRLLGAPVGRIIKQAEELSAEFIVLASHGHGAVYDLLVGALPKAYCKRLPAQ